MKISVVIPVYNKAEYIGGCLESLLQQNFDSFEIICVCDGSTDNSADICDQWAAKEQRIRVIHKDNGGVTEARRRGVEEAQGQYLMFVDADDKLLPGAMQLLYDTIEQSQADEVIATFHTHLGIASLLTGGGDVDPVRYGEALLPCCGEISAIRDGMEYPLCREALSRRMPILAICRGIQLLSCVLGGTLYQDLDEQFGKTLKHPQYDRPGDPVHEVDVKPDTLLSSIVGAGSLGVNSRHHQGIRDLGEGLRVNALSPDGLIEGVELPASPFVLGVQWHPETLSPRFPAQQKIFHAFVKACEM